jgi:hypothetical protein
MCENLIPGHTYYEHLIWCKTGCDRDEAMMIDERMTSNLYKLQGCAVAGGVTEDGFA